MTDTVGNPDRARRDVAASDASPEQLVAAARSGDADSLDALLALVRDDVYGLALRMLWDPDEAEDACQEILIKVLTHLDGYRGDAAVRTWVYRIAVNHLLDRRRSRLERQQLNFDAFAHDLDDALGDPNPALGPETELLAEEVKLGCTLAMLSCLDRDHRIAWILGEVFELSSDDAAWICDVTPATYRKRLSRARARLRAFVEANCGLVDPANACRCHRRINAAIATGRVRPGAAPRFADPHALTLRRATDEMKQLHTAASLLKDHPTYRASQVMTERIRALINLPGLTVIEGDHS
jgi:RNA polymerase sigma factor (sigma-70 family)